MYQMLSINGAYCFVYVVTQKSQPKILSFLKIYALIVSQDHDLLNLRSSL